MRHLWLRRFILPVLAGLLLVVTGCAQETSGPSPSLADDTEGEPTFQPSFTCNEQVEGWVTVRGENFSPLVVDSLQDDGVDSPTITLTLSATIEGDATDESFETTIEAPADTPDPRVKWINDRELAFFVEPGLELPPGTYDVTVTNANGESAVEPGAFGVLPRPTIGQVAPELTCVAQGERSIVVSGDHLLVDGESTPTIDIGENNYEIDEATECRTLSDAFGGAEICDSVSVTVAEGDFEEGSFAVAAHNQEPAACSSLPEEDGVDLVITGPPTVDAVSPEPICGEQLTYQQMRVTGTNFIKWTTEGETLPSVTVGDKTYTASEAADCTPIDTLQSDSAERCTELVFEIPADDQADVLAASERFAEVDVAVSNPEPVGCTSEEELALTVVPPPMVSDAKPEPVCTSEESKIIDLTGFGFLTIDGALPTVSIGGNEYPADTLTECNAVEGTGVTTESCDGLTVTVPSGELDEDANSSIVVINPESAACESTDDVTLYNAGPPTVADITPQPICTTDGDNVMVVSGTNFLDIDGTLPTVTVGTTDFTATNASGCSDAPLQDDGNQTPTQICDQLEIVIGEGAIAAGEYDVSVNNPPEADCSSSEAVSLTVLPPPSLDNVVEQIACVAEAEETFTVSGADFLIIDGTQPDVQVGGNTYDATVDTTSCDPEETIGGKTVQTCSALDFTVPQGDLAGGTYDLTVVNPDTANCVSSNALTLTIEDAPTVAAVNPSFTCKDGTTKTYTIDGSGFLVVDGTTPTVNFNGIDYSSSFDSANCAEVSSVTDRTVQRCDQLTVDVPDTDLVNGDNDLFVTNPDPVGCTSTEDTGTFVTTEPTVTSIDTTPSDTTTATAFTCNADAPFDMVVTGDNFIKSSSGLPVVSIGGTDITPTAANGCTQLSTGVESCTELVLDVPSATIGLGTLDVVVTNSTGSCTSQESITLESVDEPNLTDVTPALFCDAGGDTSLNIAGDRIYRVNGILPTVDIDGTSFTADTGNNCTAVAGTNGLELCGSVDVTVPSGSFNPGDYDVTLTNAAPVACSDTTADPLVVAGPPELTGAQPAQVCSNSGFTGEVTLTGSNFLKIDGTLPSVEVNGVPGTVSSVSNCSPVSNPNFTIESCTTADIVVPAGERDVDMNISLTNPAPADCGSSSITVPIQPSPVVDSVTPLRLCDQGGTVQIDGSNFATDMEVTLGGVPADSVTVNASGTSATATFNSPPSAGNTYNLTVTNPSTSCSDTFEQDVRVVSGPTVFYVDPPVTYNGISTQVTIYLSGLYGGSVQDVTVIDSAGTETTLDFVYDSNKPNQVQATVPKEILPTGTTSDSFAVRVTDDVNCSGETPDLLTVTDDLTVGVKDMDPPFGNDSEPTAVSITAFDTATSGQDEFKPTPRAYLNPVNPSPTTVATELRSVQFLNSLELNALVQSDQLPLGEYDLIIVNPDGGVGLLNNAFEVVEDPAPNIDSVSPGSWSNQESALSVTIEGENFRMPAAEVQCDTDGDGVADQTTAMTVNSSSSTSIDTTVDATTIPDDSVCFIRVTNTDNGTYGDFSPITVTNPAGNFVDFQPGPTMNTGRRDAAMASGQPTRQAQFIYAIGGDDGNKANAMSSIEASPLDKFGNPGPWFNLKSRQELPAPRTYSEATRVEDFVYLVGGSDGSSPVNTVWRSNVLDPLDVPEITNVEFDVSPDLNTGLNAGTYYYRVSAVLANGTVHNPGGETLTSEAQAVSIPLPTISVTIAWPSFPDAVAYRIYRSPDADLPFGNEELLAEIPAPGSGPVTYTDDGSDSIQAGFEPLPLGSLGVWHEVAQLSTARHSHGVTMAKDPDLADQGTTFYLYALGGTDGTNTLGDYEFFEVTFNAKRDSTIAASANNPITGNDLATPRSQVPLVTASPETASVLDEATSTTPAEIYLYAMGGLDGGGSSTTANDAAQVGSDGTLGTWTSIKTKNSRAGHAAAVANNRLLVAGGDNAAPSATADKGSLCGTTTGGGGTCTLPDLDRWDSLSNVNMEQRYLMGYVSYNGFIYLAGGLTPAGVSDTTDYSILGGTP